jgi:hypothetical protein
MHAPASDNFDEVLIPVPHSLPTDTQPEVLETAALLGASIDSGTNPELFRNRLPVFH